MEIVTFKRDNLGENTNKTKIIKSFMQHSFK